MIDALRDRVRGTATAALPHPIPIDFKHIGVQYFARTVLCITTSGVSMDNQKRIDTQSDPEKIRATHNELGPDPVKLVEMGDVSVETKGIVHGLELGFTPRY